MDTRHVTNLFPLDLPADVFPVALFRANEISVPPDEIALAVRRHQKVTALPHKAWIAVSPAKATETEISCTIQGRLVHLTREREVAISLIDRSWRELLRQLLSVGLKQHLVYASRTAWCRQDSFYQHGFGGDLGQGHWIEGWKTEIVIHGGRIYLAIDRRLLPLGPHLGSARIPNWKTFIQQNPYEQVPLGHDDGDEDDSDEDGSRMVSQGERRIFTERRRNYVLRDSVGQLRRVYINVERTLSEAGSQIWAEPLKDSPDDRMTSVAPECLFPILAPHETEQCLGRDWKKVKNALPPERQASALRFVREYLGPFELLGMKATVSVEPLAVSNPQGTTCLLWPPLSVGTAGKSVQVKAGAEARVQALAQGGIRRLPRQLKNLEIVPLVNREKEAHDFKELCESWLKEWRVDMRVTVAPVAVQKGLTAKALDEVFQYYERHDSRPSLLIVFKGYGDPRSSDEEPLYESIHRRLSGDLNIPVKVVVSGARPADRSKALNCLSSLLARAGAVLYGLGSTESVPGLSHDFVVGVDVGGRDRAAHESRQQLVSVVAMAGDNDPILWKPNHPDSLRTTTEQLTPELISQAILEPARSPSLRDRYRRGWLYLRDGRIFPDELAALHRVIDIAKTEGIFPKGASFTAVEIHKNHALRLFAAENGAATPTWGQPVAGAFWKLSKQELDKERNIMVSEALLASTGTPWNIPSSAEPLRCVLMTLDGEQRHHEALVDIWHLTHLNWSALRNATGLPLPLHAAQSMPEEINNRGGIFGWPF